MAEKVEKNRRTLPERKERTPAKSSEKTPNVMVAGVDPYGQDAYDALLSNLSPRGKELHEEWLTQVAIAKTHPERPKYIDQIQAPEAIYRVITNNHLSKVGIRDVYDSDMMCLEWEGDTYKTSDVGKGGIIPGEGVLRQKMPITKTAVYEHVDTDAIFGRKPVYLTDIHVPWGTIAADIFITGAPAVEGGIQVVKTALKRPLEMNRRTFIKAGVSTALLSGALALAMFPLRTQSEVIRAFSEGIEKVNPTVMPVLMRLRNLAMAYKAKLAVTDYHAITRKSLSTDVPEKKPIVSVIVGPLHSRMREFMSFSEQDLLEALEQLLTFLPHMPDTTRDELENIGRLRFNYRRGAWEYNLVRPN